MGGVLNFTLPKITTELRMLHSSSSVPQYFTYHGFLDGEHISGRHRESHLFRLFRCFMDSSLFLQPMHGSKLHDYGMKVCLGWASGQHIADLYRESLFLSLYRGFMDKLSMFLQWLHGSILHDYGRNICLGWASGQHIAGLHRDGDGTGWEHIGRQEQEIFCWLWFLLLIKYFRR